MRYHSTRGQAPELSFTAASLTGLAADSGLYLPTTWPQVDAATYARLRTASYTDWATYIVGLFAADSLAPATLQQLVLQAHQPFRHAAVSPLVQLDSAQWLLELFHGPTLAFKDYALQFLGVLTEHLLADSNRQVTVLGATSGDTGSAAIAAFAGKPNINIVILHPHGQPSEIQRRQMTTVLANNVHNIAIKGTFDDCQDAVKTLFSDAPLKQQLGLTAVNSINIARIVAQVTYYAYACAKLGATAEHLLSFCVPTGNFGNIFAGYVAKQIGLPINKLIIASNKNDILTRTLMTGDMKIEQVEPSLSPSMDIQISSNFERLLFLLLDRDAAALRQLLAEFRTHGCCTLPKTVIAKLRQDFMAFAADDTDTLSTIQSTYKATGQVVDPHTAVGLFAASQARQTGLSDCLINLACAHPAKFPTALQSAVGLHPPLPDFLEDLLTRQERYVTLPPDVESLRQHIQTL
ncbi:MAG: threonine synthase [Leptolyngbya sp. SIO4C1]|nr:threonine synthase [Leptolyngbya sp. SIO4C1]